jgi:hypothetical protein
MWIKEEGAVEFREEYGTVFGAEKSAMRPY